MRVEVVKAIPCADSRDGSIPPGTYEVQPGEVERNNRPTDGYVFRCDGQRYGADTWGWTAGLRDGRIILINDMTEQDAAGESLLACQRGRRER